MNESTQSPPIGGATLEAMFAYPRILLAEANALANSLERNGFSLCRDEELVARTPDFDYVKPPPGSSVAHFLEWAVEKQVEDANLSYKGWLYDQDVRLSLSFYFSQSVVSLSTLEDFLWGFSGSIADADFRRLDAFYDLCEAACTDWPPKRGAIGSETCHVDEISLSNATDRFTYTREVFFSETARQSLFSWYVNIYAKRWNNAQHLDCGPENGSELFS